MIAEKPDLEIPAMEFIFSSVVGSTPATLLESKNFTKNFIKIFQNIKWMLWSFMDLSLYFTFLNCSFINIHCVKYAQVLVFCDSYFPVFGQNRSKCLNSVQKRESMDQGKPEFGRISCSERNTNGLLI